jgi:hypothetical protein
LGRFLLVDELKANQSNDASKRWKTAGVNAIDGPII